MERINRIFGGLASLMAIAAGFALAAMSSLIVAELLRRLFLRSSFIFVEEYSGYMVLAVMACGVSLALRDKALLRVDFLLDRLSSSGTRNLQLLYDLLALIFSVILTYQLFILAFRSFKRDMVAATVTMTPLFIPQIVLAVGLCVLSMMLLNEVVQRLAGLREGAAESRHNERTE